MKIDSQKGNESLSEIKDLYDEKFLDYDSQEVHILTQEEKIIWNTKIFSKYLNSKMNHILDVGSGTGLLTRFISAQQLSKEITGLEYSKDMIEVAQQQNTSIKYKNGDTHEQNIFESEMFDCIISRQVACHFHDPLEVFKNWHKWLKNNGYVIVVDGLWLREGWSSDDLVDMLPISCLQTRATIPYLLQRSGFEIIENDFFDSNKKKYFVIAKKSIE